MSKQACLLPSWYTLEIALDCSKHKHIPKKEAPRREAAGEIVRIESSRMRRVQYVIKGPVRVTQDLRKSEAARDLKRTMISATDMVVAFTGEPWSPSTRAAVDRIENRGSVLLKLNDVTYDAEDIWFKTEREHAKPVLVRLRQRGSDESVAERAKKFINIKWPGEQRIKLDDLGEHLERRLRDIKWYKRRLDDVWQEIFLQFHAGEVFSKVLTQMKARELPPILLYRTLEAYLAKVSQGPSTETIMEPHQGTVLDGPTGITKPGDTSYTPIVQTAATLPEMNKPLSESCQHENRRLVPVHEGFPHRWVCLDCGGEGKRTDVQRST